MLLAGGTARGQRILSPATVAAMVAVHVERGPDPDGALGWGLGLAVHRRQAGIALAPGSYGWDGGLGTSWANDPANRLGGRAAHEPGVVVADPAGRDAGLLDLRRHRHGLTEHPHPPCCHWFRPDRAAMRH